MMDVTREIRKVVHKQLAKLPDGLRVDAMDDDVEPPGKAAPRNTIRPAAPAAVVTRPAGGQTAAKPAAKEDAIMTGLPPSLIPLDTDRQARVLQGVAEHIVRATGRTDITAGMLYSLGVRCVQPTEPPGPGGRMRHPLLWWPAAYKEPLMCARYVLAAKHLLDMPSVRKLLGVTELLPTPLGDDGTPQPVAGKRVDPVLRSDTVLPGLDREQPSSGEEPGVKRMRRSAAGVAAATAAVTGAALPLMPLAVRKDTAPAPRSARLPPLPAEGIDPSALQDIQAANDRVLQTVEMSLQQLHEALELAHAVPPAAMPQLPQLLTDGMDEAWEVFVAMARRLHDGLAHDHAIMLRLLDEAAGGAATDADGSSGASGLAMLLMQRAPFLAFRAALRHCAEDAATWLHQPEQSALLERLGELADVLARREQGAREAAELAERLEAERDALRREREVLDRQREAQERAAAEQARSLAAMRAQLEVERAALEAARAASALKTAAARVGGGESAGDEPRNSSGAGADGEPAGNGVVADEDDAAA